MISSFDKLRMRTFVPALLMASLSSHDKLRMRRVLIPHPELVEG
jgi:hypothetical protein